MFQYPKIYQAIDRFITVSSTDPDDSRRRKLLNIVLLFVGGLTVFVLMAVLFNSEFVATTPQELNLILISTVITLLAAVTLFFVNRQYSGWLASTSFLIFLSLVLAFSDTPKELINGRSLVVFAIPIVMASILLRPYFSFVFAGLTVLEMYILGASAGIFEQNLIAMAVFFMIAALSWISSRTLETALRDLRVINAELDKRVSDRTYELSQSLSREAAQASQREAILNSIADGVVVFDNNGVAIVANPSISTLTRQPQSSLIGQRFSNLLDTDEISEDQRVKITDALSRPAPIPTFRMMWGKKTLSVNASEVKDIGKQSIGTVAVFRDVTREAELEKMKDTFVAVVSHELRTPLNAILGFAEMIKETVYGPVNESQHKASLRIMDNTSRLLGIVSELLDQAQIQSGRMKINMTNCTPAILLSDLQGTMEKIAEKKGLRLVTVLDPEMPVSLRGDPQRLQQIMINLANNAVKFTEKGEIRVALNRAGPESWKIQVSDTGDGIPDDALGYVFETFRQVEGSATRKYGGVGLGLSIVKQLAELMGGNVGVQSKVGFGSIFTVTLPLG